MDGAATTKSSTAEDRGDFHLSRLPKLRTYIVIHSRAQFAFVIAHAHVKVSHA